MISLAFGLARGFGGCFACGGATVADSRAGAFALCGVNFTSILVVGLTGGNTRDGTVV